MNTFEEVKEFVKQLKSLLIQRYKMELDNKLYELESDLIKYGTIMLEQNYDLGSEYKHLYSESIIKSVKKEEFERLNKIKRDFFSLYNELNEYIVNHSDYKYSDEYYKQQLDRQSEQFNKILTKVHTIIDQRKKDDEFKDKVKDKIKDIIEDSC